MTFSEIFVGSLPHRHPFRAQYGWPSPSLRHRIVRSRRWIWKATFHQLSLMFDSVQNTFRKQANLFGECWKAMGYQFLGPLCSGWSITSLQGWKGRHKTLRDGVKRWRTTGMYLWRVREIDSPLPLASHKNYLVLSHELLSTDELQ